MLGLCKEAPTVDGGKVGWSKKGSYCLEGCWRSDKGEETGKGERKEKGGGGTELWEKNCSW